MELDRKDLKIEALKQRLAEITVQYEDKDADRRVEITFLTNQVQELRDSYETQLNSPAQEAHEITEE